MNNPDIIKEFYRGYADRIVSKRWRSKYPLRAYVHERQYQSVLSYVKPGMNVLDAGCGEGILSLMMAEKGACVTGVDLSIPNVEVCIKRAAEHNLSGRVSFQTGDVEHLPFEDNFFDLVVSSHVLEHVPDFNKGLSEVIHVRGFKLEEVGIISRDLGHFLPYLMVLFLLYLLWFQDVRVLMSPMAEKIFHTYFDLFMRWKREFLQ
ncbi:MAG: Methyltransferase type 11 [Parcubacteria group bacterium GW2011_GWC1_38_6]|nr:MAG: Methyltransferase type 11 [Parcubacteria group bacterium GW2011_GWC1_38_6]